MKKKRQALQLPPLVPSGVVTVKKGQSMLEFFNSYATAEMVADFFGVHRSTAYRYMRDLHPVMVRDLTGANERMYSVVPWPEVFAYEQPQRGNPGFRISTYQAEMRSRHW